MGSAAERGLAAEQRVAAVLMAQGWEVLEHRWRCRHGEMDLLLHRQGRLLIVEVKCRTGAGLAFVDGPGNCLGWRQQQRLHRAFGLWLQARCSRCCCRHGPGGGGWESHPLDRHGGRHRPHSPTMGSMNRPRQMGLSAGSVVVPWP